MLGRIELTEEDINCLNTGNNGLSYTIMLLRSPKMLLLTKRWCRVSLVDLLGQRTPEWHDTLVADVNVVCDFASCHLIGVCQGGVCVAPEESSHQKAM